jgi:hypothetical protein
MLRETPTYTTYKEFCGNHEQPWVTMNSAAVDWTQQETTRDQARIRAVLTLWGDWRVHPPRRVGNSRFAQRLPAGLAASMA